MFYDGYTYLGIGVDCVFEGDRIDYDDGLLRLFIYGLGILLSVVVKDFYLEELVWNSLLA